MYGQTLPATGAAVGLTAYASLGLGLVTLGLVILTLASLARQRRTAKP